MREELFFGFAAGGFGFGGIVKRVVGLYRFDPAEAKLAGSILDFFGLLLLSGHVSFSLNKAILDGGDPGCKLSLAGAGEIDDGVESGGDLPGPWPGSDDEEHGSNFSC